MRDQLALKALKQSQILAKHLYQGAFVQLNDLTELSRQIKSRHFTVMCCLFLCVKTLNFITTALFAFAEYLTSIQVSIEEPRYGMWNKRTNHSSIWLGEMTHSPLFREHESYFCFILYSKGGLRAIKCVNHILQLLFGNSKGWHSYHFNSAHLCLPVCVPTGCTASAKAQCLCCKLFTGY